MPYKCTLRIRLNDTVLREQVFSAKEMDQLRKIVAERQFDWGKEFENKYNAIDAEVEYVEVYKK